MIKLKFYSAFLSAIPFNRTWLLMSIRLHSRVKSLSTFYNIWSIYNGFIQPSSSLSHTSNISFILLSKGTRDKRVIPSIKSATSISDANSVPSDPFLNWNWQNLWKSEKISGSGIFLGANSSSRHFLNLEYGTVVAVDGSLAAIKRSEILLMIVSVN